MIGELFPKYQSCAKRMCLIIVGLRQLQVVTACSRACRLFRRRRSDSVPWFVEVSKGYQSIHIICLRQRGINIVQLFVVYAKFGKIHRSRKQLPCAIHGFHRLRSAIHESGRSTDCAHNVHLSCTVSTSSANVGPIM